jgi:hypothetical protein
MDAEILRNQMGHLTISGKIATSRPSLITAMEQSMVVISRSSHHQMRRQHSVTAKVLCNLKFPFFAKVLYVPHLEFAGFLSLNVLFACSFDLRFTYVYSGWEGSASDSRVWDDARRSGFHIHEGRFLLADAGFPSCDVLLTPYRGIRYHLREFSSAEPDNRQYVCSS